MNLRDIIIEEIISIHSEENFGKTELESLEDIELFHLFISKVRRDAWERGFENGHDVGFNAGLGERDDVIKIEVDIPEQNNLEENQ